MPSIKDMTLACAFISFAIAAPAPVFERGRTARVYQNATKGALKSGPAALVNAYTKFGGVIPDVVKAAAANNDGTVSANPEQYDSEYLCPVTIGGQTLNLDFDTGSSDLWVYSSELSKSSQSGHSIYNPTKSSTSKLLSGATWSISYGDGSSASGNVYTDTVNVGGTIVTKQAVELAEKLSSQFLSDVDNDGLLGLAFNSINTVKPTKQATFFSNAESSLAAPLFTANLKKGGPGLYDFGFIDTTAYNGAITYVPVKTTNGFWEFTGSGYSVAGGSSSTASIDAIADTGTTLLLLPDAAVTAYYAKVPGASFDNTQGGYTFTCTTTLPAITLKIGGYNAVVPGSYINYAPASGTKCFGGIQSNSGIGFSIYGDIFLKSQFVVFDATGPQLGFAAKST